MVYLDSAATARPNRAAVEEFVSTSQGCFGNSASLHKMGLDAERRLEKARHTIALTVGAQDEEIYFTSGGTESNNIALLGAAAANPRGKILTTAFEHSAVYKTAAATGLEHITVGAEGGAFDLAALENALTKDVSVVSTMLVNNETGLVVPVPEIVKAVRQKAPKAVIHCDAVQAYGKIPFTVGGLGVDMLSASAHKIGGVKGVGFLYIKNGTRIVTPVHGGGHEKGVRSGTVNVPGICAFEVAAKQACENIRQNYEKASTLRAYAAERLSCISGISFVNAPGAKYSPYILSISLEGMRGETLLHYLSDRGVYVATASACSSHAKNDRRVLETQGISKERAEGTLRISFGFETEKEDIDALAEALEDAVRDIVKGVR